MLHPVEHAPEWTVIRHLFAYAEHGCIRVETESAPNGKARSRKRGRTLRLPMTVLLIWLLHCGPHHVGGLAVVGHSFGAFSFGGRPPAVETKEVAETVDG